METLNNTYIFCEINKSLLNIDSCVNIFFMSKLSHSPKAKTEDQLGQTCMT